MKRVVIGIAGLMGAGKSTVTRCFESCGAMVIDADRVVDLLYEPGMDGYNRVRDFFGEDYLTSRGNLNRKKLAHVVFSDPKKLKILHTLLHPLVTTEIQKMINKSRSSFIVLEATYFEKNFLRNLVHAIVWVETAEDLSFERITERRKIDREWFEKIRRLQTVPPDVDVVLNNDGSPQQLEAKVRELYRQFSMMNFSRAS